MEPQDLIDTSSSLRGIGHVASRMMPVRSWSPTTHVKPWEVSARWEEAVGKPRATRNPSLGAAYVLDTPFAAGYTDAIVDARAPTELIGTPTRFGARVACRTSQQK